MAQIKIQAEIRTEFGKGAARRIRRADKVPGVLYEHGTDPIHMSLPGHELMMALKNSNALLSIELPDESHLAIPKQVQRDILRGFIEHVDLLIVKKGEKVTVHIPVLIVGEAAPDTLIVTEGNTISLEVEATNIPHEIELSIAGLQPGTQVLAKDLILPEGATLAVDEELMLVNVINAPTAADLEADLETDATEATPADGAASATGDASAEGADADSE